MDLSKLTVAIEVLTRQNSLTGIKAGLAIAACVFLYFESQARFVTDESRKRLLTWIPGVVAISGLALAIGVKVSESVALVARLNLKDTALPIFTVIAAAGGLIAIAIHGIDGGVLKERSKQLIGGILAVFAVLLFFLFFHLSYKGYYHRWELFHYYMGSKYAKELSYTRIYSCAAVADAETGNEKDAKRRKMRDLRVNNLLIPSKEILAHPEECKDHFASTERWEDFKRDVVFFRKVSGRNYWNDMQKDHGYNPPPIWTIAGHYLSVLQPANDAYFKLLAAIDVVLTGLLFIAIGWAFGWRVLIVSAIFWGTQEPAPFYWTGGAFLRQDWFFFAVLAACLARKNYFFWAGAALAYAAGLRAFPVFLWVGPFIVIGWHLWKHHRFDKRHLRLIGGAAMATAVLLPLSVHVAGGGNFKDGVEAWKEFKQHISVHKNTALTNHMGLETVLKTTPEGRMKYSRNNSLIDPFERWKDMRTDRGKQLKVLHYGLLLGFGALLVWVLRKVKSMWVAMGVSLIFVVGAVETTCYYFSIWILAALLAKAKREMEWPLLAVFFGVLFFLAYKLLLLRAGFSELVALGVAGAGTGLLYWYNQDSLLAFARSKGSMDIAVIGLAAASQLLTVLTVDAKTNVAFIDDKFAAISALYVAWTLAFVFAFFRAPKPQLAVEPVAVRTSLSG